MQTFTTAASVTAAQDHAAYSCALDRARCRARHSYFAQYVILEEDGAYLTLDEGDYGALPMAVIDRIVHVVPGGLIDEI